MRRRLVDRRKQPRFEIVGQLWGTVETVLRLPIVNVGLNGALLESHGSLPVESIHQLEWDADGHDTSARVKVKRSERVSGAAGATRFLIAVEFLDRDPILTTQIQRWIYTAPGRTELEA